MAQYIVFGKEKEWEVDGNKGVRIYYGSANPINYDGMLGFLPISANFDPVVLSDLTVFPALYEATETQIPAKGKNGATINKTIITSFKFISKVDFIFGDIKKNV